MRMGVNRDQGRRIDDGPRRWYTFVRRASRSPAVTEGAMLDQQTIARAVETLHAAVPGSLVILFGSYARGDATAQSDLDLLVVMPRVGDRLAEMARLRRALTFIPAAVDLIVMSRDKFDYWKDTSGTLAARAVHEGKRYESAA